MNKVLLSGRLVKDPELKSTLSNIPVATFTVAVDRRTKDKQTDFIDCVAWEKTAEFISRYFTKGKPIEVEGRLQRRKYTDREGATHYVDEVVVSDAGFGQTSRTEPAAPEAPAHDDFEEIDDDLPF